MERVAFGAALGAVVCLVTPAIAKDLEVSSLDVRHQSKMGNVAKAVEATPDANYITDVSGKRVRLVGPRFFPDNSNSVSLFGREQALAKEAAFAQMR